MSKRTVAVWWSEVAWVSADRERHYVQQGGNPWEAVDSFVGGARLLSEWLEVSADEALEQYESPPPEILERFCSPSLLPDRGYLFAPDKGVTYLVHVTL